MSYGSNFRLTEISNLNEDLFCDLVRRARAPTCMATAYPYFWAYCGLPERALWVAECPGSEETRMLLVREKPFKDVRILFGTDFISNPGHDPVVQVIKERFDPDFLACNFLTVPVGPLDLGERASCRREVFYSVEQVRLAANQKKVGQLATFARNVRHGWQSPVNKTLKYLNLSEVALDSLHTFLSEWEAITGLNAHNDRQVIKSFNSISSLTGGAIVDMTKLKVVGIEVTSHPHPLRPSLASCLIHKTLREWRNVGALLVAEQAARLSDIHVTDVNFGSAGTVGSNGFKEQFCTSDLMLIRTAIWERTEVLHKHGVAHPAHRQRLLNNLWWNCPAT